MLVILVLENCKAMLANGGTVELIPHRGASLHSKVLGPPRPRFAPVDITATQGGIIHSTNMLDFQKLLNDSASAGIAIVPPGLYLPTVPYVWPAGLKRIVGAGKGITRVEYAGSLPATLFAIPKGVNARIEGLTVTGPGASETDSKAFLHLGGSGSLRLRDVQIAGWKNGAKHDDGCELLRLDDCDVHDCWTGVLGNSRAAIWILDTYFRRWGVPGSNQYHAVYSKEGQSLHVERCDFDEDQGLGFAVHTWGEEATAPEFCRVINNRFGPSCWRGILTNDSWPSLVQGNVSQCRGAFISKRRGQIILIGNVRSGSGPAVVDYTEPHEVRSLGNVVMGNGFVNYDKPAPASVQPLLAIDVLPNGERRLRHPECEHGTIYGPPTEKMPGGYIDQGGIEELVERE